MNNQLTIVEPENDTWENLIKGENGVLLYFWVEWSNPCKSLDSMLDRLEEIHPDLIVERIDVNTNKAAMRAFNVELVPTLILFSRGDPVEVFVDEVRYSTLERAVKRYL